MTEADQKREDDVLRRMLNTPHRPHKPTGLTPSTVKKQKSHKDSKHVYTRKK